MIIFDVFANPVKADKYEIFSSFNDFISIKPKKLN